MLTATLEDTISRIRKGADIETTTDTKSICPDDELTEYINDGLRELHDIITEVAGPDYSATTDTLTAPYDLPEDFLQCLGVDYNGRSLRQFTIAQRNVAYASEYPRFRIASGSLVFNPSTFAGSVTLHYIPVPVTLVDGTDEFTSVNGWDVYVVAYGVLQVRIKQEYPTDDARRALARAEQRVRRAAARIRPENGSVLDVTTLPDEYYIG